MPLSGLDVTGVSRSLSQIADQPDDLVDTYFERLEEVELPPADEELGLRVRREEGFAIRLLRSSQMWLAARDGIDSKGFTQALRQVARALPSTAYPEPALETPPLWTEVDAGEMLEFPGRLSETIRRRHAAFPYRLTLRRHRRWLRVIGTRFAPEPEHECYYSCLAETPWGSYGAVLSDLDTATEEEISRSLIALFRSRDAPPVTSHDGITVLAPAATAVLLHEVVSHALETDTLALSGRVEAAVGVQLGSESLDVLDDPGDAPRSVRRQTDDEGTRVTRRWLLRRGVVEQPLADLAAAFGSSVLTPGAGRRASRFLSPAPRSTHLKLMPGESAPEDLLAESEGGLFCPQVAKGTLDPLSGRFTLYLPYARKIGSDGLGEMVGPCRMHASVSELLAAVTSVGCDLQRAGAGWCAKGGLKMPVWATAPSLRVEGIRVEV